MKATGRTVYRKVWAVMAAASSLSPQPAWLPVYKLAPHECHKTFTLMDRALCYIETKKLVGGHYG
jgi:hypothetical protein